ncbi:hypothetical protein B0H17DRAFT_1149164 [Mycena rosella]|uniref:Uncharacterized protein n=1 Tax=Mycena rosella TaxID=1033263 RepID=A0AAD7FUP3_MYCRO|nr:hypothetical protein B0H17DRAFT_1149164 [Mycena rosella]
MRMPKIGRVIRLEENDTTGEEEACRPDPEHRSTQSAARELSKRGPNILALDCKVDLLRSLLSWQAAAKPAGRMRRRTYDPTEVRWNRNGDYNGSRENGADDSVNFQNTSSSMHHKLRRPYPNTPSSSKARPIDAPTRLTTPERVKFFMSTFYGFRPLQMFISAPEYLNAQRFLSRTDVTYVTWKSKHKFHGQTAPDLYGVMAASGFLMDVPQISDSAAEPREDLEPRLQTQMVLFPGKKKAAVGNVGPLEREVDVRACCGGVDFGREAWARATSCSLDFRPDLGQEPPCLLFDLHTDGSILRSNRITHEWRTPVIQSPKMPDPSPDNFGEILAFRLCQIPTFFIQIGLRLEANPDKK